jgi:inorganic triphosphatase YgiF
MGVEFELKYGATQGQQTAIRQGYPAEEQIFQMETTYYDTPTGQFSARKCTLRRRLENGVSICTLKTPDVGFGRREWEVASDSIEAALEELCKLGAPEEWILLGREGLVPICGACFTRIAKTVSWEDATLELALDQGILTGGDREMPLCEVEVELKSGSQESCLSFARQLSQAYGLAPEPHSKFRRALALYQGETL